MTSSHAMQHDSPLGCISRPDLMPRVGVRRRFDVYLMNDAQLSSHITHCGIQLQAAYKLGMKDEAHSWRKAQEEALWERARRPQVVAAMEAERGLA